MLPGKIKVRFQISCEERSGEASSHLYGICTIALTGIVFLYRSQFATKSLILLEVLNISEDALKGPPCILCTLGQEGTSAFNLFILQKRSSEKNSGGQDSEAPCGAGKQGKAGVVSLPTDPRRLPRTWHLTEHFWARNCGFRRNIGDIIKPIIFKVCKNV